MESAMGNLGTAMMVGVCLLGGGYLLGGLPAALEMFADCRANGHSYGKSLACATVALFCWPGFPPFS